MSDAVNALTILNTPLHRDWQETRRDRDGFRFRGVRTLGPSRRLWVQLSFAMTAERGPAGATFLIAAWVQWGDSPGLRDWIVGFCAGTHGIDPRDGLACISGGIWAVELADRTLFPRALIAASERNTARAVNLCNGSYFDPAASEP